MIDHQDCVRKLSADLPLYRVIEMHSVDTVVQGVTLLYNTYRYDVTLSPMCKYVLLPYIIHIIPPPSKVPTNIM